MELRLEDLRFQFTAYHFNNTMIKKIEIFENTLLKLLVRRGVDADRLNVILSEGELGYTTDTKKLYVGDGQTAGGIPVFGSAFLGANPLVTSFTNAVTGDLAFDSDNYNLYSYKGTGVASNIANWLQIGGVYTAGNNTINVNATNGITVGTLSAGNFSPNALGNSLGLDTNNKISLNSSISIDNISLRSGTHLSIPSTFSVNNVPYRWPGGGVGNGLYLATDISGNLSWATPIPFTSFVAGSASQIPVGSIMPFVSSANAPAGWLICNGQSVAGVSYRELSSVIGTTYGGNSTSFNVPDFINKSIYGVQNNPAGSTTYRVASGTNTSLSAAGAIYIIKAKPDTVVTTTLTVTSPLTATVNGNDITNTTVSILSGDIVIGTPSPLISSSNLDLYEIINFFHPVSSVLFTYDNNNPQNRFPNTTWEQVAQGRFIVGNGTGTDANANVRAFTPGNNSGEYTHQLTVGEIPSHTHSLTATVNGIQEQFYLINDLNSAVSSSSPAGIFRSDGPNTNNDAHWLPILPSTGGDAYHNNVPPGYALYAWVRKD